MKILRYFLITSLLLIRPLVAVSAEATPLELSPGVTKLQLVGHAFQTIIIGNPNVANASAVNMKYVSVTGKGVGLTNIIILDESGNTILDRPIQVVSGNAYISGDFVQERHEIKLIRFNKNKKDTDGREADERYLCSNDCSQIAVDNPPDLNPPASKPSSKSTRTETDQLIQPSEQTSK